MGDFVEPKSYIKSIFEAMEYGNEAQKTCDVSEWLKDTHIGALVSKAEAPKGQPLTLKDAHGAELCTIHVPDDATIEGILQSMAKAKNVWLELASEKRADLLYKLGAELQKQEQFVARIEIVARGLLPKDTKKTLLLLTDCLQYYSSFAYSQNSSNISKELVVAILPDESPLSSLGLILAPCLASGQRLVLQTGPHFSIIASFLIQLSTKIGVPEGTIRLIPGSVNPDGFFSHSDVSTVCILDDLYKQKYSIANHFNKKLLHFHSSGSAMVVFDNCDLDSASCSVVQAAWSHKGTLPWSVRKIFVQENVFGSFLEKLKHTISSTKMGHSNEKVDISYPDQATKEKIDIILQQARNEGVEVYQPNKSSVALLIGANIFPNNVIKEDVDVPVVTVTAFRTVNEAASLANNSRNGLGVSIWTESTSLANEIVGKINAGNVWINSHGLFAPDIATIGHKSSGNCFIGGTDGFYEFSQAKVVPKVKNLGSHSGQLMEKAISEARKAQGPWVKLERLERIRIIQKMAQNLEDKYKTWTGLIHSYVSGSCAQTSVSSLKNFNVVSVREAVGVVAVEDAADYELVVISALVEGNSVILLKGQDSSNAFPSDSLPGVFRVVPQSVETVKVAALHKALNAYIGEPNKVFSSLPLKYSSKLLKNKVYVVKNVWFNKGHSFA